jgi:hypothetical protein
MLGVEPTEGRFAEPEQGKSGANFDYSDVSGTRTVLSNPEITILGISRHLDLFGTGPGSLSWSDSTF